MPTRRFQLLDARTLWEVGLPVLAVWLWLLVDLVIVIRHQSFASLTAHWREWHFNFVTESAVVAGGGALVWVWVLLRANSSVTIGEEGIGFWFGNWNRWTIPWDRFLTWEWQKDFRGRPLAIMVRCADLETYRIQFGLGTGGTRKEGLIYPNTEYLALLEALAQYVPHKGTGWAETAYP